MTVAGQAAYQLVLAPRSSRSLIGQVRIAIDSQHRVPLRVQVFARGAATPGRPGRVHRRLVRPAAGRRLSRSPRPPGPGSPSSTRAPGRAPGAASALAARPGDRHGLARRGQPARIVAGRRCPAAPGGGDLLPFRHSASAEAPGSAAPGGPGAAPGGSLLGELLNSAPRVSGSWGSGRLIRTSLLSILVTSTGRVLIGAVTPSVLYQAATQPGHPLTGLGQHASSQARPK